MGTVLTDSKESVRPVPIDFPPAEQEMGFYACGDSLFCNYRLRICQEHGRGGSAGDFAAVIDFGLAQFDGPAIVDDI